MPSFVTVTGTIYLVDGSPAHNHTLVFDLSAVDIDEGVIHDAPKSVRLGADGVLSVDLWPNTAGLAGTIYKVSIVPPRGVSSGLISTFSIVVPDDVTTVDIDEIANVGPPSPVNQALLAQAAAQASATQAAGSASNAATSATNAGTSETNAATSETNAGNSAGAAAASATNAATSAGEAADSESNAADSADDAAITLAAIENIFDNFDDRYLGTKTADPVVDNDGDPLSVGAVYYNSVEDLVKFYNGTTWEAPSQSAMTSAAQAAQSASDASDSADAAADSESNADTSETNAATSAGQASVSAGQAVSAKGDAEAARDIAVAAAASVDIETGTWDPDYQDTAGNSIFSSSDFGGPHHYVRNGNLVMVTIGLRSTGGFVVADDGRRVVIGNLPFRVDAPVAQPIGTVVNFDGTGNPPTTVLNFGADVGVHYLGLNTDTGTGSHLTLDDLQDAGSRNVLFASVTYYTEEL